MTQYLIMPTKRTPQSRRHPAAPRAFERPRNRAAGSPHGKSPLSQATRNAREARAARAASAPHRRQTARSRALAQEAFTVETQAGNVSVTRRQLLIGVGAIAGVVVAGVGGMAAYEQLSATGSADLTTLEVPEGAVVTNEDFASIEPDAAVSLAGSFELPYGTQVWANSDTVAVCLVPGETSTPLATVALLWLGSGTTQTVLGEAIGQAEGFSIFDVRASDQGIIWVEADIPDGTWRVYTATLSADGTVGQATLVEEGDSDWEMPQIAAVADKAFWQMLPRTDGEASTESSTLRAAQMGSADAHTAYTSDGRMATPPYGTADGVVITPRAEASGVYYQLTYLDAASESVLDSVVLPASMRPLEAGYGETGFMFSFDAIYDYGDGISQLGTYAPSVDAAGADYSASSWFRFGRTPTAAPSWCGSYLMVKSTTSVVGANLATNEVFALPVEDGADDYGDYLATTGTHGTVVTFSNIDDDPISGEARTCCLVRVWAPL